MYIYKLFGLIVQTDVKLFGNQVSCDAKPEVRMIQGDLQRITDEINDIIYCEENKESQIPTIISRHLKKESIVFVRNVGLFRISNGTLIEYNCYKTKDDLQFQQWLMAMAFSILIIQREKILLHGTVLKDCNNDKVIGICGESGAGKSTIGNELLKRGLQFISDDEILIDIKDAAYTLLTYPWRRICMDVFESEKIDKEKAYYFEDGKKQKYVVDMTDECIDNLQKLDKLFILSLSDCENVEIEEIVGADKINLIIDNLYKKTVYEEVGIAPNMFKDIVSIAKYVDIYLVKRPINKMTIDEITTNILNIMGGE